MVQVRFNPSESQLFATAASDRNICLYDLRTQTPIHKTVLRMRTNALAWNPREVHAPQITPAHTYTHAALR